MAKAEKIYDAEGNWIGIEIIEYMSVTEAQERYPGISLTLLNERGPDDV